MQNEEALLLGQNIPGIDKKTIDSYLKNTHVRGASQFDLLQMLADAAVITKGKDEALGVAPVLAAMKMTGGGLLNGGFGKNPEVLNKHLEMMFKVMVATGGRVSPETYQSIVRTSRGYTNGMDPDFFYYQLEPLAQEYGKSLGPMIAQFHQHMTAGRITTTAAELLEAGGLLDGKDVNKDKV
jgi:hypothetical protein